MILLVFVLAYLFLGVSDQVLQYVTDKYIQTSLNGTVPGPCGQENLCHDILRLCHADCCTFTFCIAITATVVHAERHVNHMCCVCQ